VKNPFVSASLCFPLVGLKCVLEILLVTDDSVATMFALASPNSPVTEVPSRLVEGLYFQLYPWLDWLLQAVNPLSAGKIRQQF
jgi:hypothetical protein